MYWNINEIMSYQRNFNFINGARSIGKTYTTLKYCYRRAIERGEEFVYLVRTKQLLKSGALEEASKKVLQKEFPEVEIKFKFDRAILINGSDNPVLAYCLAISDYVDIKKRSFPNVKYIVFDEYMLEDCSTSKYIKGWKEPDIFLNIYQTIDRDEDRVICFMLGNNTTFYNPYHMHPAFNIPYVQPGKIWKNANVLFQWAVPSAELKQHKAETRFSRMVNGSDYGEYANAGQYTADMTTFILERSENAKHYFILRSAGKNYGVWADIQNSLMWIDDKFDPSCKFVYALTTDDHRENTMICTGGYSYIKWLAKSYKAGNLRFTTAKIKAEIEKNLRNIL